jgi:hypothetical protein
VSARFERSEQFEKADGVMLVRRTELDWLGVALLAAIILSLFISMPQHPEVLVAIYVGMLVLAVAHAFVQIHHPRALRGRLYTDETGLRLGDRWISCATVITPRSPHRSRKSPARSR